MKASRATTLTELLLLKGAVQAAAASTTRRALSPTVKSYEELGNVQNPEICRDSCGSVKVGDRALWTCRDSQPYGDDGKPTLPVWSSSASWTNFNGDGGPSLDMYGNDNRQPYFIYPDDECSGNSAGGCDDGSGSRFALWPDSPPMVVSGDSQQVVAYTWIRNFHLTGLTPSESDPKTSLYKLTYDTSESDRNVMPSVELLDDNFWAKDGIPYGVYGNVVRDGTAYLYAQPSNNKLFLAKVPASSVEDKSQYQYWVNGGWSNSQPAFDDDSSNIEHGSAGGQGTYYYSDYWNSYVWIGGAYGSVSADFYITTSPNPEGPWEEPVHFYQGENGSGSLPAYSLQANPALSDSSSNEIYITWTKTDDVNGYVTPMTHIVWN